MKNASVIWEIIYLLMLMCAGIIGVVSLVDRNNMYVNYRFLDKSLIEVDASIDYVVDVNLLPGTEYNGSVEVMTAPALWDSSYSAEDLIAMIYIQDDTCPSSFSGDMKLSLDGTTYTITDRWGAQKEGYLMDVRGRFYSRFNNPDLRYYLMWDKNEDAWKIFKKNYEYVFIPDGLGNYEWKWRLIE